MLADRLIFLCGCDILVTEQHFPLGLGFHVHFLPGQVGPTHVIPMSFVEKCLLP